MLEQIKKPNTHIALIDGQEVAYDGCHATKDSPSMGHWHYLGEGVIFRFTTQSKAAREYCTFGDYPMPNQYTPGKWHPAITRDRLTPIQGLPPGSVDKELAKGYHLSLYAVARPCR